MASNFKILISRTADGIHLKLCGDFDGTAAHELLDLLRKHGPSAATIHVDTQGLRQVHSFGLCIFSNSFRSMNDCADRIVFQGEKAPQFAEARANTSL